MKSDLHEQHENTLGRHISVIGIEDFRSFFGFNSFLCVVMKIATSFQVGCTILSRVVGEKHSEHDLDQRYSEVLCTLLLRPTKAHFAGTHPIDSLDCLCELFCRCSYRGVTPPKQGLPVI